MSDTPHEWGGEHFCRTDAVELYQTQPQRLAKHGFPVALTTNPVPATFCSRCLRWFDDPANDDDNGSEPRPPTEGQTHGNHP